MKEIFPGLHSKMNKWFLSEQNREDGDYKEQDNDPDSDNIEDDQDNVEIVQVAKRRKTGIFKSNF